MHPFDIKTIFFAKHAQHVVLIHFPIALFIIGMVFDFLAQWRKQRLLSAAAYYNLLPDIACRSRRWPRYLSRWQGTWRFSQRSEWTGIEVIQNFRDDASVVSLGRGLRGPQPPNEARSQQALAVTRVC